MKGLKYLLTALFMLLALSILVTTPLRAAQVTATPFTLMTATPINQSNPNVVITSPVLVSELHGPIDVQGTANLPNMTSYFLEIRVLNPDASIPSDDEPWIPVTLPASTPVQDGVLVSWDTTTVADGLYALRLTATAEDMPSVSYVVTPLRVNNAPFATPPPVAAQPTATEVVPDTTPRVTAILTANVRTGDSTLYPVIDFLVHDDSAEVLGISTTGSGWYFIRLPDGSTGWIAPFVVVTSGDFSTVPGLTPPPLPVTPTLTPIPIAPNLQLNGIALNPSSPVCGAAFNVQVNVTNTGNGPSDAANVFVQDVHVASGTVTTSGLAFVPPLNPGDNFTVTVPLTVTTYYGEAHQIRANLASSQITTSYALAQGGCNVPPPTIPRPTVTPVPPTITPIAVAPMLQLRGVGLNPATPSCGVSFNVVITIANIGNGPSGAVNVFVQDVHLASGTVTASGAGYVPPLGAGVSYRISIPVLVTTFYNELHQMRVNLGDSHLAANYTLMQGQCNPANAPVVTFTSVPVIVPPTPVPPTEAAVAIVATLVAPSATPSVTLTPVPPTRTPTFTRTPIPPTATRVPPTVTLTRTPTPIVPTVTPTFTPPPTLTPVPPTRTPIPPTVTPTFTPPPTLTPVPPTRTPIPPTASRIPPTVTPIPSTVTATLPPLPTLTRTPTVLSSTPTTAATTAATTGALVDLGTIPFNNLDNPAVQARIKAINGVGKGQGVTPGNFRIVGDTTLSGLAGLNAPNVKLDQYDARYRPLIQFFEAGFQVVNGPSVLSGYTSGDLLNPAKGASACANNTPMACALDSRPAVLLITVGRNDINANVPLNTFRTNLTADVDAAIQRGVVPVLVTIVGRVGPANEPKIARYNQVIYEVANAEQLPLLNLYRISTENPAAVNPATGTLTASPTGVIDLSPAGLKFGANAAALHTLEMLFSLKNAIPLG